MRREIQVVAVLLALSTPTWAAPKASRAPCPPSGTPGVSVPIHPQLLPAVAAVAEAKSPAKKTVFLRIDGVRVDGSILMQGPRRGVRGTRLEIAREVTKNDFLRTWSRDGSPRVVEVVIEGETPMVTRLPGCLPAGLSVHTGGEHPLETMDIDCE